MLVKFNLKMLRKHIYELSWRTNKGRVPTDYSIS